MRVNQFTVMQDVGYNELTSNNNNWSLFETVNIGNMVVIPDDKANIKTWTNLNIIVETQGGSYKLFTTTKTFKVGCLAEYISTLAY